MYIPKIYNYLKILSDEEVKDFVAINFNEYFKPTTEKMYSKLNKEQNLRKVAKLLYIFLTTPDEVEKYVQSNSSDNCMHQLEFQLITTKPMIKNKLKELLSELKKFKVQAILVLDYKKRNDHKIFHSSTKLTASDRDID